MQWTDKHVAIATCEQRYTARPRKGQTQSGYGVALPTEKMLRLPNEKVWRRMYCVCFSNAGTCYVRTKAGKVIITD